MNPQGVHVRAGYSPQIVLSFAAILALLVLAPSSVTAQGKRSKKGKRSDRASSPAAPAAKAKSGGDESRAGGAQPDQKAKTEVFDFTGLQLTGSVRTPQLLYFLDRAAAELEQAALERRSFVPEMARSIEEESL